jgi:hypothetical protein
MPSAVARGPVAADTPPAFCPVAPAALVRVCELVKEVTWPAWLCPAGMRYMRDVRKFTIRDVRTPPFADLACYAVVYDPGHVCGQ